MKYSDLFNEKRPWFSAKSLFYDEDNNMYEERIILLNANTQDEALDKAKDEAIEYAKSLDNVQYAGYSEIFNLFDTNVVEGVELYSTMRKSELSASDYIEQFLDTGNEIGIQREEK